MEIRELRHDTISAAEATELARLNSLVDPRRLRSDPPVTAELAIDELRPSVATYAFAYWGLFDDERLVGLAEAAGAVGAENADVCELGVWVDPAADNGPELRRRLFDHAAGLEKDRGRTRFWGWGDLHDEATRSFWEDDLGYTLAYDERISRCTLADIDGPMLQQWVDRAAERASGYHLVRAEAPFDDQLIAYFAQALEGMNDAPLDALEHEPESYDAERARQIEHLHLASNSEYRGVFAIETETGELAGYTATRVPRNEPALSKQGDTVTINAHRNQGIGRWLKADMIHWLQQVRPEVESLATGNAESNRAMLAINEQMGFHDVLHHAVWHKLDS